jgi:hypothetical protein
MPRRGRDSQAREIVSACSLMPPAPLVANPGRHAPPAQNACAGLSPRERMGGRGAAESLRQFRAPRRARHARTRPPRDMPSSRAHTDTRTASAIQNIAWRRLWACRIATPSEHDDAQVRKANEATQLREFVPARSMTCEQSPAVHAAMVVDGMTPTRGGSARVRAA